ncbi:MAG: metallophosphoesterase, partial [Planctomycetota bacterium]
MKRPRMPVVSIAFLLGLSLSPAVTAAGDLVPPKSTWRIWDRADPPPKGWEKPDFDDSAWRTAKAPFGINVPERAARKAGMSQVAMRVATYYRIRFEAERQSKDVLELELYVWLRRTQGLVAWLNGTEIDRRRMPEAFDHTTLSKKYPIYTRYDMTRRRIRPGLIRQGTNVLAMTVHLQQPQVRFVPNLDARLTAVTARDNRFVAGPIVSGTYPGRAVLTFDTRLPSTATLRYGPVGSPKTRVLRAGRADTVHKLAVKNLTPDTVYAYDLGATRAGGTEVIRYEDGRFRTSPAKPGAFTFGVFGDTRGYPPLNWREVAKAMLADEKLDFHIGLGDYVDHGDIYEEWETQFFGADRAFFARRPMWTVIGNHDNL